MDKMAMIKTLESVIDEARKNEDLNSIEKADIISLIMFAIDDIKYGIKGV